MEQHIASIVLFHTTVFVIHIVNHLRFCMPVIYLMILFNAAYYISEGKEVVVVINKLQQLFFA